MKKVRIAAAACAFAFAFAGAIASMATTSNVADIPVFLQTTETINGEQVPVCANRFANENCTFTSGTTTQRCIVTGGSATQIAKLTKVNSTTCSTDLYRHDIP